MSKISLTVNGKAVSVDVEDRTLLVHLLRPTKIPYGLTVVWPPNGNAREILRLIGSSTQTKTTAEQKIASTAVSTMSSVGCCVAKIRSRARLSNANTALNIGKWSR